jgi:hypothetical protein
MLENYYIRPVTIDRIRGSWIAPAIEQYVGWLGQQRYTSRSVLRRVPILVSFGEFAKAHGASELGDLPAYVEPFVEVWVRERAGGRSAARRKKAGQEARNPLRQMLRLAIPGYIGFTRSHKPYNPFELGHVDVSSTAVYLTTTPELLEHANCRFRAFAAATLREGLPS